MIRRACWCGARTARRIGRVPIPGEEVALDWIRCTGCGVYTYRQPPTDQILARAYAPEYYGATRRKFTGPIAAAVEWFQDGRARMVAREIEPGTRVLDVGCGNGGFLARMARRGFQVEGTEWTAQSAARVDPAAAGRIHVGDLLDLELPPAGFEAITLWHVFEHLPRPAESLARIRDLLVPGGVLFLALPNHESAQARRTGRHWFHLDPPRHLCGFGPRSLRQLAEPLGFTIQRQHTWSLEQNPYGDIQSALNARGFPRDRAYGVLKGTVRTGRWADLARLALLAPCGVLRSSLESIAGRGATMTLVLRRS